MLPVIHQNRVIILENIFAWLIALGAAVAQIMPLFQMLAYLLASVVSVLTAIKIIKELFSK
jgi:hypothetical protein